MYKVVEMGEIIGAATWDNTYRRVFWENRETHTIQISNTTRDHVTLYSAARLFPLFNRLLSLAASLLLMFRCES